MSLKGILRITKSDFTEPLNLGSTEMVSMNEMMQMISKFESKNLKIKHIPGPQGVRGRNSDSTLILEKLGWEPTVTLNDGLHFTYDWIKDQINREAQEHGFDFKTYATSQIVTTAAPKALG